jgi:hypothetical protein
MTTRTPELGIAQCKTPTPEGWRFFLELQGDVLVANRGIEPRTRGFSILLNSQFNQQIGPPTLANTRRMAHPSIAQL